MLHRQQRSRRNVLHRLHRGALSEPQYIYSSVYVSIVARATFRTRPLPIAKRKIFVFMSAIGARFTGSCPLSDLTKVSLMFETFELQYLNKLTKCQVRYFTSPKAFHSSQVQRFKSECIKASTQVSGEFPMPILTLPSDFPIESCELPDSTPPVSRTFFLTRKVLVKCAELFQGLLQELRGLYLLTCAKRQVSVFHTEVCPHTFTRSGQGFGRSVVSDNVKASIHQQRL